MYSRPHDKNSFMSKLFNPMRTQIFLDAAMVLHIYVKKKFALVKNVYINFVHILETLVY